jgi:hypothetical protein
MYQKHYKALKECIYKVLYELEQATKSYFRNCLMSAKDLIAASHLQPCGIEWLKLLSNASKTLQSIKRVYLQIFVGIGTCNQKLF